MKARMRLADEHGATLMETLVTLLVTLLVFGVVGSTLTFSGRQERYTTDRVQARDDAARAFARMTRELRQALEIDVVSPSVLRARIWVGAQQTWVRYDCSAASRCTRKDESGGPPVSFVEQVANADVFSVRAAAGALPSIDLRLERRIGSAATPLVLETTVTPRNCLDGLPMGSTTCPG